MKLAGLRRSTTAPSFSAGAMSLRGQTALISGASRGVGAAVAAALAREGAAVCLTARSAGALDATADVCRAAGAAHVSTHPCDMADPQQVERLAREVLEQCGGRGPQVLVLAAGTYPEPGQVDVLQGEPDRWDAAFELNVCAPMRLTRRLAPAMAAAGRGCIVLLGSVAGLKGVADEAAYTATKWALRGWAGACYEELKGHGVKVCLVEPSHVATDMALAQEGTRYAQMDPGKMIQVEDVAEAALLALRLGPAAAPTEIVLNRLQTPHD